MSKARVTGRTGPRATLERLDMVLDKHIAEHGEKHMRKMAQSRVYRARVYSVFVY